MNTYQHAQLLIAPRLHNTYDPAGIGYIDAEDPTIPVLIRIGPYIGMMDSDYIELFWGEHTGSVANYTVQPEDTAEGTGSFVLLPIAQPYIVGQTPHRVVDIWYTVKRAVGGTMNESEKLPVTVKLNLPGGIDPNPATPYENETLALPIIMPMGVITSPDGVSATLMPWLNMTVGDKVMLSWQGEFIPYRIDSESQIGHPQVIPVPREIIEMAGDSDRLEVRYEIRDVVNNWSRWSLPAYVEVEVDESSLPAPVTPQAPNMVLDLDLLQGNPVQALVLAYPDMAGSDDITLVVERNTAEGMALEPYVVTKNVQNPASFVEFLLPFEQFLPITQGRARLKYTVEKASGGILRSKSLSLTIKGETQQLEAPHVPAANNGVLDPASRNVLALVPPYYFMASGNVVTLVWSGKTASGANVMHEELKTVSQGEVGRVMEFHIPDDKVSVLAGGSVEVHYTVATSGGAFVKSPVLPLRVSEDISAPLPVPQVKEARGDTLYVADTVNGMTVVVAASARFKLGDRVLLNVKGPNGSDSKEKTIQQADVDRELSMPFTGLLVSTNVGQTLEVLYGVRRASGTEQTSTSIFLKAVQDLNGLRAPTLDTVGPDGILNPINIPDSGATLRVSYEAMSTGDSVIAHWQGASNYDTPSQVVGGNTELLFTVPKTLITATAGNAASVTYSVTRAGTARTSLPLMVRVSGGLVLDNSPVTLSGKIYLIPGSPDLLPNFPADTTIQRVASGGQAPYAYSSSDTGIVQVDSNGLASVRGKGTATISVSDALGESKSYQVTVTGVIHCLGLGTGSYAQMNGAAQGQGARIPSVNELNEIFNSYGNRWPMGNGNYWSSTVAAHNIAGMKWYYVKNLVTGANFKLFEHNASLGVALR